MGTHLPARALANAGPMIRQRAGGQDQQPRAKAVACDRPGRGHSVQRRGVRRRAEIVFPAWPRRFQRAAKPEPRAKKQCQPGERDQRRAEPAQLRVRRRVAPVEVCSQQRSLSESRRQLQPKSTVVALTVGRDGRAPPPPLRPQGRLRRQRRHSAGLSAGQGPAAARCVRGRAACAGRVGAAVPDHLGACRKGSPAAADNPDGAPLPPGARRLFVSALG